jgi:hypothetical protein
MRTHPADGITAVGDVLRPDASLGHRTEPVIAAHDDVARATKVRTDTGGTILRLVAFDEAAAMDEDHRRAIGTPGTGGEIEIELLLARGAEKRNVAQTINWIRHLHRMRAGIGFGRQSGDLRNLDRRAKFGQLTDAQLGSIRGEDGAGGEQQEERTHKGWGRGFLPRP